ncbi:MAG: Xaa-Pro aminopeptidase [Gammaproteobacteria bacterium]|nr:Xaa-Pro aminopeptidase [Gammaproteobacteria bacterium]
MSGLTLDRKEFARRRKSLMRQMDANGVAILFTAPVRMRNRDVEYAFRPDSDFYYLTGFPEPEAVMVLVPGRPEGEYLLFVRERDLAKEVWNGRRAGLEGACAEYGADDAFPIGDIDDIVPGLIENRDRVFYAMGVYPDVDQQVMGWVSRVRSRARAGVSVPGEFVALDQLVHEMRLVKSAGELRLMRRAAEVTAAAHVRAMRVARPGMTEYQVEAELVHAFMSGGCRASAYAPIVGSGENGVILHYTENRDPLRDGDLLLIDAGAEYEYYAADITRTFPVNGRFTPPQRELYELVLQAQEAAIAKVRPGNHWNEPHEAAVAAITRGLVELGLLKGRVPRLVKEEAYKPFYMHRTGHWLGMDVHDVGDYKVDGEWRVLEPGMTMTVEPGLYVAPGARGVPRRWWGIGIRIEDDVLVTRDGCEVLTRAVPKTVADVEALMASAATAAPEKKHLPREG